MLQTDGNPGDPNPSNNGLSLWAQFNGKLVMAHAGNGGTTSPTAGVSYSTGTWYKIDMINTTTAGGATTNSFYVNNVLVASDNIASSLSQPRLGFASGAGNSTNAAYDSMKVWSFDSTDSLSSVTSAIGIPEPTSLAAAFVAGAGVLRRRRHFGA